MKKILLVLLSLIAITATVCLCACGDSSPSTPSEPSAPTEPSSPSNPTEPTTPSNPTEPTERLLKFEGITFPNKTVTYDGNEQSVTIAGTLPDGTQTAYTNNTATNAGVYNASVVLTKTGYEQLTLTATLTINKADFSGITFENGTFIATGSEHTLTVEGTLPEGTTVTYTDNSKSAAGEYTATATLTNPNFNELVLTAKLKVLNVANIALQTINSILDKPDPWSFLPEAFKESNMAYSSAPVSDFTSFVNVSAIGGRIIGKQFNVLYEGLVDTAKNLGYVDTVSTVAATVAGVYQTFINDNPESYAQFSGEAAGFKFRITLEGNKSELMIGNSTVSMELSYDKSSEERCGRIQITDGIVIKYSYDDNHLNLAVKKTVAGVGNLKQIEFVRNGSAVSGYLHEYTGTESNNLKTSAVISSNSVKTVIMSNKRESDDLVINGYEEVYDSRTGKYIGGEVQETIKVVNYDTLWFMLADVSGFNSVKVLPESNGLNADSVYVNGSDSKFATKKVNALIPTSSRRYDIEMKDVWYVVATTDGDKTTYETVKCSIPMLFIQVEQTDTFGTDVQSNNSAEFAVAPALPPYTAVTSDYASLQEAFNTVKEQTTYEDIVEFIGDKNTFFTE